MPQSSKPCRTHSDSGLSTTETHMLCEVHSSRSHGTLLTRPSNLQLACKVGTIYKRRWVLTRCWGGSVEAGWQRRKGVRSRGQDVIIALQLLGHCEAGWNGAGSREACQAHTGRQQDDLQALRHRGECSDVRGGQAGDQTLGCGCCTENPKSISPLCCPPLTGSNHVVRQKHDFHLQLMFEFSRSTVARVVAYPSLVYSHVMVLHAETEGLCSTHPGALQGWSQ